MKKILMTSAILSTLFVSGLGIASAQYYNSSSYTPYYNVYQNAPSSNSYIYTQGCYRYQYDRYTNITSLLGSTCTTQPTTSYTYPTQSTYNYQYQTYPYTYPTSQYQTYGYNNYSWSPSYSYNYNGYGNQYSYGSTGYNNYNNYNSYTGYTGYNNNYGSTNTSNGCYWSGGYQACY